MSSDSICSDTYGVGYTENISDMSSRMKSVLAVNGDSYSNNRNQNNGTIIRNGVIYRNEQTDAETCVLNWDGTMDIYQPGQVELQQLIEKGHTKAGYLYRVFLMKREKQRISSLRGII